MNKIAIYSRKSKFTGKGESIENQILKCKQFIQFKFEVTPDDVEIFIDEGFSGKNENRPRYQDMLQKIKNKEIDKVVIYQLNRLGRNARDIHNTMQMCEDLGCVIYSATEGFDSSTSFGRAIIGILASLAQLEREQLAERVKDNMYTLAKMGRWLGGQCPLGYNGTREYYIDESGKERSVTKLKPNTEELKIVKLIYKKYIEEKSLSQVGKWSLINNFKGKNGGNIDKSAINVILQNPVYVKSNDNVFSYLKNEGYEVCGKANGNGLLRYAKDDEKIIATAAHKGVIDADTWLEVQQIIKSNSEKAPSIGKSKQALLTGLLKCKCGAGMQVRYGRPRKDGTKSHYYLCTMKVNSSGSRCNAKNINGELLENKLIEYLKTYNKDTLIKSLTDVLNESKKIEDDMGISNIDNDINTTNDSIKKLLSKLSLIDDEEVSKIILTEIKSLKDKIKYLEKKKSIAVDKQSEIVLTQAEIMNIINRLDNFNSVYDDLDFDTKKIALNDLLESIIYDGKKFHLKFNVKKN
ncbi:recombinase family protein [Clostridium sp. MSJ-8]|uniref:recombinase family protein n=1 Tax=Clostridium sp. MSJ-8 TaxID=2841510 RepID=UPI001C0F0937|nr:recombinase family protein [Clostridium sp. MSJ-8]MBU5486980.1 recombinase family protein [Clostridium sp. MSJ-8]